MGSENKTRLTDIPEEQNFQVELSWQQLEYGTEHRWKVKAGETTTHLK